MADEKIYVTKRDTGEEVYLGDSHQESIRAIEGIGQGEFDSYRLIKIPGSKKIKITYQKLVSKEELFIRESNDLDVPLKVSKLLQKLMSE